MSEKFATVDEYLDSLPVEVRDAVVELRGVLYDAVPGAEDAISYNMPAITRDGRRVVHYAGWKKHVSIYPVPETGPEHADLERELAPYLAGKGTLKFPLDQALPRELVTRVAQLLSDAAR